MAHVFRAAQAKAAGAALFLCTALAACTSLARESVPSLEPVIVFANPSTCQFGEPLERLFAGLAVWNDRTETSEAGPPFEIPGLPQPVVPRLERLDGGYVRAFAPVRGRWRGLTVTGIEAVFLPETDDQWEHINFAESRERVLAVLNANGFGLDPRSYRSDVDVSVPDWEASVTLSLEQRESGSSLGCTASY